MVHDSSRCCQDDIPELTRRQQLDDPLLKVRYSNVVSGRDDAGLVDTIAEISCSEWESTGGESMYRPLSWITILPDRWSSTSSNSPM